MEDARIENVGAATKSLTKLEATKNLTRFTSKPKLHVGTQLPCGKLKPIPSPPTPPTPNPTPTTPTNHPAPLPGRYHVNLSQTGFYKSVKISSGYFTIRSNLVALYQTSESGKTSVNENRCTEKRYKAFRVPTKV